MRRYLQPRALMMALLAMAAAGAMDAQEVVRLVWPTRHAAPPASASSEAVPYLPVLRASLKRLPEAAVVNLALMQSSALGLGAEDGEKLGELVRRRYALIAADPRFKTIPTTLEYCFSEARPRTGMALMYRPERTNAQTPVLLFVHGYGGSFLWYLHQLAEWFPDHIIVAPSYGIDPSDISRTYLDECLREASVRFKHPLAKPSLIGLSAGGFGATRVYATGPSPYRQLIVMAAYPPDESFRAWPKSARAGFLVGALEYYVKDGGFAAYSKSLAARSAWYQSAVIPKADHFFLLTHPVETRKILKTWLPGASP